MSRRIADLLIKIGADSYEFQQKASQVQKGLGQMEKKLTDVGKSLSLKLTAPLAALGTMAVANANTQAKAEAKVQTALTATGNAVGFSMDQLKAYASELQGKTLFGDETILNDATARLLNFTNITGENFKRTQQMALDMATALEMDLGSASTALGKALDDPIGKMSSLSRIGVTFTEEQKKVVKSLVESGQTAKAQTIILDELEKRFGGQAQAAAKTGVGAVTQLKNAWGDFTEQIGRIMIPIVNKIAAALTKVVGVLSGLSPTMQRTIVVVGAMAAAIGPLCLGLAQVAKLLPALKMGFALLTGPVGVLSAAVLALAAAFMLAKKRKQELFDNYVNQYEGVSQNFLENRLKEVRRLKAVNQNESPFQGQTLDSKINYALNKGDRTRKLQAEEDALVEVLKRRKESAEEAKKVQAEAARMASQMAAAIGDVTDSTIDADTEVEQAAGLIGKLKDQIDALEKKKLLPTATIDDIAQANEEIAQLKEQLNDLENITPEELARRRNRNLPKLEKLPDMQIQAPALEVKMPDLAPVTLKYQEQAKEIFATVRDGLYGWAEDTSSTLQEKAGATVKIVQNYTEALTNKGWKFSEALEHVASKIKSTMEQFDQQVSRFLSDSIAAAAEAIGQMITGDLGFGGLMKAILTQLASFLRNIGSQLIEFGVMIIGFKSALKSVLANPWAAIGIGAAMVAAAAVMTALINKSAQQNVPALANGGLAFGKTYALIGDNPNASVDPEVVAPLSKLQQMLPSGGAQNMNITLGGELVAKGRDLVYVLNKENFKSVVLGG